MPCIPETARWSTWLKERSGRQLEATLVHRSIQGSPVLPLRREVVQHGFHVKGSVEGREISEKPEHLSRWGDGILP